VVGIKLSAYETQTLAGAACKSASGLGNVGTRFDWAVTEGYD